MSALRRRRNKLPFPRFQLRLIGGFVAMGAIGLLLQSVLVVARLMELANRLPVDGAQVSDSLPRLLLTVLVTSLLVILPATLVVGVFLTFRWAGPLYRFHRHLEQVAAGEDPGPCRLREDDELQELCGLINRAIDTARAQGAVRAADESAPPPVSEAA